MSEESILAALSVDNARAHVEHIIYQIPSKLAGSENGRQIGLGIGGLACVAATDQEKSCNRQRLRGFCLTQRARHSDHGPA